ncbi:TetR/AcrR family transcriptional regulator [Actinacidiphila yeochonensis]|uniref:TetR/AcrR family transcriptional regulator n=1 Tax=Actinacidiphila yeochonensis TaxID=89050 RepID=UPI0007C6E70C|nr:TetR/AcrR family transcriptional regulator [Actinacidiphila yeochonensis]
MASDTPRAGTRPLRSDAARNRELILRTARGLFAAHGTGVGLNDIARAAGIGVGTVYRRFPDKEAILDALVAAKLAAFVGLLHEAAEVADPREALRGYLWAILELRVRDRALHDVLARVESHSEEVEHHSAQLRRGAEALVTRAREAGVVRADFTSADFPVLMEMIGTVTDHTPAEDGAWRRWAALLVDAVSPPG